MPRAKLKVSFIRNQNRCRVKIFETIGKRICKWEKQTLDWNCCFKQGWPNCSSRAHSIRLVDFDSDSVVWPAKVWIIRFCVAAKAVSCYLRRSCCVAMCWDWERLWACSGVGAGVQERHQKFWFVENPGKFQKIQAKSQKFRAHKFQHLQIRLNEIRLDFNFFSKQKNMAPDEGAHLAQKIFSGKFGEIWTKFLRTPKICLLLHLWAYNPWKGVILFETLCEMPGLLRQSAPAIKNVGRNSWPNNTLAWQNLAYLENIWAPQNSNSLLFELH